MPPVLYRQEPKKCGKCGAKHYATPKNARYQGSDDDLMGFYWECQCGSTLFRPGYDKDAQAEYDENHPSEDEQAENLKDRLSGSRYT